MLERLIDLAVRRRIATLVLTVGFAALGLYAMSRLEIEAFSDVTDVEVMVISLFPGQAAEEVERQVTIPVEQALFAVPNVLLERSITSFGLSQVIVTFEDGADVYFARQQIAERLPRAEVPEGVTPRLGPNDTPVGQIYQYTLESDRHSPSEIRSWQDWVVAKNLARVPGVADIVSFGGYQKEYHLLADPSRLRESGLTLKDLIAAVHAGSGASSGGHVQFGETEFVVHGRGYLQNITDLENTVVIAQKGTPILVRNLAKVVEGYTPRRGAVARGEAIDSVEGTILLRRGENARDVLGEVHEAVARINRDVLPKGMRVVPFNDRTKLIGTTLSTVASNVIEGALLAALVLFIFLRALPGWFAVAITMPLALLAALVGLHCFGAPANLLSIGALDVGILLGGAAILVDNVYRHLAELEPTPDEVPGVVAKAAREVARPILFWLSLVVAAMLPLFKLERAEGRIFRPVALTYALALGGALSFTLTCVPALLAVLLRHGKTKAVEPGFLVFLRVRYERALRGVHRFPAVTCLFGTAILALAVALVPRLGTEYLPEMNEGDIHIAITMPTETSLERGAEVLRETRLALLEFPEVSDVMTEQGHPEDGTDDEAPNQAETFVLMKPEAEWRTGRSKRQIVDAMRAHLEQRPGVDYNFSQPIENRVKESASGVRGQIVVKVYGDDLDLMHGKLSEVAGVLRKIRGARDVEIYRAGKAQHIVADIDREATARIGVPVGEVEESLESAFGGRLATALWEGERKVGVRVKLPSAAEGDVYAVSRLEVPAGSMRLPLGALAKVHVDSGRTQIHREQGGRFLALQCNVEGRDIGSFVGEAQARVAKQVELPDGYSLGWGGEFENQRRAMTRLMVIVPISIGIIFLLLYLTFRAALPAMVVLLDVPFAAAGGVFALYLTHTALSVSAAVGFITLFGVAVMVGALFVTYLRRAHAEHGHDARDAIVAAVSQGLRPVLMTALLASLGLLPAAMSHAIGSDAQRPFAIVIIGGLLSSTILTLLLLPTLYEITHRWFGTTPTTITRRLATRHREGLT